MTATDTPRSPHGRAIQLCEACAKPYRRRRVSQRFCSRHCQGRVLLNVKSFQHLSPAHKLSAMGARERVEMNCVPEPNSGCWLWTGASSKDGGTGGYGRIGVRGRLLMAHRFSYEAFRGPIPDGLFLDHLCRVHSCVNPDHLEAVTPRVNVLRGQTICRANAEKTHCLHGHAFSAENTYIVPRTGERACRTCARTNDRRHYHHSEKRRRRAR